MNYIAYRFKLSKLNFKRKDYERYISKEIAEARKNESKEKFEKLHSLLSANKINYEKSMYKLQTRYFSLWY